jgi:hypothetical protein
MISEARGETSIQVNQARLTVDWIPLVVTGFTRTCSGL